MSYPKNLDEYEDKELTAELERRIVARQKGQCDYCGHSPRSKPCRFVTRHLQLSPSSKLK